MYKNKKNLISLYTGVCFVFCVMNNNYARKTLNKLLEDFTLPNNFMHAAIQVRKDFINNN